MNITVIHGPNLNLLGTREPAVYGTQTLAEINEAVCARGAQLGVAVEIVQHSSEGAIVDAVHAAAAGGANGIVINPAAYTHYSIAIRDALAAAGLPAVEVHLSNIHAREAFRERSVVSGVVAGVISGLGAYGYLAALEYLVRRAEARGGAAGG